MTANGYVDTMGNSVKGNGWARFWARVNALSEQWKSSIAVGSLVVLSIALVALGNSFITWSAAAVAAVLTVLKEIWSTIGSVAETEAQEEHDVVLANADATKEDKKVVTANLRSRTSLKRTYEIRASVCGLFATILGIPAVVALVAAVYPF